MEIKTTVTQNTDGTHTITWEAVQGEGSRLHDINVGVREPAIIVDGSDVSRGWPIYVWSDWNNGPGKPNETTPQLTGSMTLNLTAYVGSWTALNVHAYICQFDTPESEYDEYSCKNADVIPVPSSTESPTNSQPNDSKGKGKGKNNKL